MENQIIDASTGKVVGVAKLIDTKSRQAYAIGDTITDFRGQKFTLKGFYPQSIPSTGRVVVRRKHALYDEEFYPSVFNTKIEFNPENT